MRILGIDTSSQALSLAIMEETALLGNLNTLSPTTHSLRLLPSLDALVLQLGIAIESIDVVAVSAGPGSFTGIRIGLSTAKALCYSLGCRIVGVSTLEALALSASMVSGVVVPIIEAGRDELYRALFSADREGQLDRLGPDELVGRPLAFTEGIKGEVSFVGEAAVRYRETIEAARPQGVRIVSGSIFLAGEIARLGRLAALKGEDDDPAHLDADYVRKSDAEVKSGRNDVR